MPHKLPQGHAARINAHVAREYGQAFIDAQKALARALSDARRDWIAVRGPEAYEKNLDLIRISREKRIRRGNPTVKIDIDGTIYRITIDLLAGTWTLAAPRKEARK